MLAPPPPVPPVDQWPRALRTRVHELLELRITQTPVADLAARRQASNVHWLRAAAHDLGLINEQRGTPASDRDAYDRLVARLAPPHTEAA